MASMILYLGQLYLKTQYLRIVQPQMNFRTYSAVTEKVDGTTDHLLNLFVKLQGSRFEHT